MGTALLFLTLLAAGPQDPCGPGGSVLQFQPPTGANGYFSDLGCDGCADPQVLADDVTLPYDFLVERVQVYGGYFPTNTPVDDRFHLEVRLDEGGRPGTVVYSEPLIAATRELTGQTLFGVDEYLFTLTPAAPPLLLAGAYWFQLSNDTGAGTDDWFWEQGFLKDGPFTSAYAYDATGVDWIDFEEELSLVLCGTNPADCGVRFCDETQAPANVADISISRCDLAPGTAVDLVGGPPGEYAYLLIGNGNGAVSDPPGSSGDLCVLGGGCLGRYSEDVRQIDWLGRVSTDISDSVSGGPTFGIPTCGGTLQPGETWVFQYWHRRPGGQPSGFSSAISVTFQ